MTMRCAIYARYSTDRQSPLSIGDQFRRCREHAEQQGWKVSSEYTYSDEALSGVGADRPGLTQMLEVASHRPQPFVVVLVDDTSRLSRNQGDIARIFERLNFLGIRLVAVSQGIDSENEQADVLMTVHGLVDSLYTKELAKKTHRGLEGRMLKGQHTGGRCYGYRSVAAGGGGVQLAVEEQEAAIVRRIFEMYASGRSLKLIAKTLNSERVPPPRRRLGRTLVTWCPTSIYEMLQRELYIGRIVWNRSRFVKTPGTNKRVSRPRPRTEWRTAERPELRIVSEQLWKAIQDRFIVLRRNYQPRGRKGLFNRSATSSYLFSGLIKCGLCGANLVIISGHGPGQYPRYGCSQHHYRGACENRVFVRRDFLEQMLLSGIEKQILQPEILEYTLSEFTRQLKATLPQLAAGRLETQRRRHHLEQEISRLVATAAETGPSAFLVDAIRVRERQLEELDRGTPCIGKQSIEVSAPAVREFVAARLSSLRMLLLKDANLARAELRSHVQEIRMVPRYPAEGKPYYVAEGNWDLLGEFGRTLPSSDGSIRLVAGARFERATFGL